MLRNQGTRMGYFEIISTYFNKIYYNYLYEDAANKTKKSNNISTNIVDEYRNRIVAFNEAIKTDQKYYYDTLKDLWETFRLVSPITLPEFIDTVVKLFIPESYHEQLLNEHLRDRYMGNILITIISEFSTLINKSYINKITNEKLRSKKLIIELQDDFNNVLEIIRNNMNQKITNQSIKSNESVPIESYNKMKMLLAKVIEAKNNGDAEIQELKNKLALTNEYKKKILALESEINDLKLKLNNQKKRTVSEYINNIPRADNISIKEPENDKLTKNRSDSDNDKPTKNKPDNENDKLTKHKIDPEKEKPAKEPEPEKSMLSAFITDDDEDADEHLTAKEAFAKKQLMKKN
jgi:hypothetical protein